MPAKEPAGKHHVGESTAQKSPNRRKRSDRLESAVTETEFGMAKTGVIFAIKLGEIFVMYSQEQCRCVVCRAQVNGSP